MAGGNLAAAHRRESDLSRHAQIGATSIVCTAVG